jgi:hypothetical protein
VQREVIKRKAAEARPSTHTPSDATYARYRKANPVNEPLPVTFRWMARLPSDVRPHLLLREFPRIANALALEWRDPELFRTRLYDLLVDKRGNRRGFPVGVQAELLALRAFFDAHCVVRRR